MLGATVGPDLTGELARDGPVGAVPGGSRRGVTEARPQAGSGPLRRESQATPYNRGAGEGLRPFEPPQTRAPVEFAGGGIAPRPPVAHPDG